MAVLVAYLTHPLGPKNGDEVIARQDNIASAVSWFRFLVETTRWVINCPWFSYIVAADEEIHRPRALMDQMFLLDRSDMLVQTGGYISPHMEIEEKRARWRGIPVVNLTPFGRHPPMDISSDQASAIIAACAAQALAQARVTWMPPLLPQEIRELEANRKTLIEAGASMLVLTKILASIGR